MFYAHFDENKNSKVVSVILYIVVVFLMAASVFDFFFSFSFFRRGEIELWLLLICWGIDLASLGPIDYVLWLLRRVGFSEDGIIVQRFWKQKIYPWDRMEEYGIFAISLFTNSDIRPYFFFILSSPKTVKRYCRNLSDCSFLRRKMIAIRYTENRNRELEAIMKKGTKIYDWSMRKYSYDWNPNRDPQSPPQCPWPEIQRNEEEKRKKKRSAGETWKSTW